MLYEAYGDYFCVEQIAHAKRVLREKIGLDVIDARPITKHGTDQYQQVGGHDFPDMEAFDIAIMKRNGTIPSYESMFDTELYDLVLALYKDDVEFYKNKFGSSNLPLQRVD